MTSIRINGDYKEIDALFNRLSNAPSRKGTIALEAALNTGLTLVKLRTHIDTGSLSASEKAESEKLGLHTWEGTITAGGPSGGAINDPVDYAIYEKARGGEHDFFEPLKHMDSQFIAAIHKGMS